MLLSEKEMQQILRRKFLEIPSVAELVLMAIDQDREEWKVLIDWYCEEVARAIAQAEREGVVWEGGAVVKHECKWEDGELVMTAYLHFDEIGPGWLLNVPDGQRVRVYVATENALQPESKVSEVDGEESDADGSGE